uniref:PH domain-containing protein n=1 Tax=Panagrolaimus sp. PS1159 TaxID=55785 RepID=A0AC35GCQ2_9BILA
MENENKTIIHFGTMQYYKTTLLNSKWKEVYGTLYSNGLLEWCDKKKPTKLMGSINLKTLIPYFCIGSQTNSIIAKPILDKKWNSNTLIAIAKNEKINKVYWFYFESVCVLEAWINGITLTLPNPFNSSNALKESNNTNNEKGRKNSLSTYYDSSSNDDSYLSKTIADYGFGSLFHRKTTYYVYHAVSERHRHQRNSIAADTIILNQKKSFCGRERGLTYS